MVVITELHTFSSFVEKIHNSILSIFQTFRWPRHSRNTYSPNLRSQWCGCGVGGSECWGQHSRRARRLSPTSKATLWNQNLEYEFLAVGWHWEGWWWWWLIGFLCDQSNGCRDTDKFPKKWTDKISSNPRNVLKTDFHFGISEHLWHLVTCKYSNLTCWNQNLTFDSCAITGPGHSDKRLQMNCWVELQWKLGANWGRSQIGRKSHGRHDFFVSLPSNQPRLLYID